MTIKRLFNILEYLLHICVEYVYVYIHVHEYIFFKDFEAIAWNEYATIFQFNASNDKKRKYFGHMWVLLCISTADSESQNPLEYKQETECRKLITERIEGLEVPKGEKVSASK